MGDVSIANIQLLAQQLRGRRQEQTGVANNGAISDSEKTMASQESS